MKDGQDRQEGDLAGKLKWVILFRLLFALVILGATFIYGANENISYFSKPLNYLYWLTSWIILLSLCYILVYPFFKNDTVFAYLQSVIDTFIATTLIDRKSTRLNSSHRLTSRMPSSA
jgi:two-component system sensor histidine kinase PilS (NtrC family)